MIEINVSKVAEKVKVALGKLEVLTKKLKVMSVGRNTDKRKVVVSSKDLIVSGMSEGTKIVVEISDFGLRVRRANVGDTKVRIISSRVYPNRQGVEPVLDIRHQQMLEESIGKAKHVHVVFKKDEILINPIMSKADKASVDNKGLAINIDQTDENGLYSGIIQALEVIKDNDYSLITVDTVQGFLNSQEFVLFSVQLRRLGYNIVVNEREQLVASFESMTYPKVIERINVNLTQPHNNERRAEINHLFSHEKPLSTFTLCTGGVDISALEADGFYNSMALDYRPVENRDYKKSVCKETGNAIRTLADKTDSGAISAVINSHDTRVLFNEDIYEFDTKRVSNVIEPANLLHVSLLCDDFSCLKNMKDRLKAIETLDTTRDMFFEVLDKVRKLKSATVLVENVKNFSTSVEALLFETGLKRLGYSVYKKVLNALDYNGMTNRQRCYIFGSTLPGKFNFPKPINREKHAWNDVFFPNVDLLRDVSHTKSVEKGLETGRIRIVREGDSFAPTITKSQSRQTKDSVYVEMNGKYYLPSNEMLMQLMGFVKDFDLSVFNSELTTEIIGQSIEVPMHRMICKSIKQHILDYSRNVKGFAKTVVDNIEKERKQRIGNSLEQQFAFEF